MLPMAELGLLISHVLNRRPTLAKRYVEALRKHPATRSRPWNLIAGFDEYKPGSQLNYEESKKIMCMYVNFRETFSTTSGSWFTPLLFRSRMASLVSGGTSHIFAYFFKRALFGPHGLATVGISFQHEGNNYVIHAQLGNLLSDGDGLRVALGWRGANSFKPCSRHINVWKKNSGLAHRLDEVEITCTDYRRFRVCTKQEFLDNCDMVEEGSRRFENGDITQTMFETVRNLHGMSFIPGGLSYDPELRRRCDIIGAVTVDWVHTFFQDGIVSVEAWLVLTACQADVSREDVEAYFQRPWMFPHSLQTKGEGLHRVFSHYRLDSEGNFDKIRASASELLGLYALLHHFLESEVPRSAATQLSYESFTSCCDVVDWILKVRNGCVADMVHAASELRTRYQTFLNKHMAAHGDGYIRPKHHWAFDVADHWERDVRVLDAFVIERLHLGVKEVAQTVDKMPAFEHSVLAQVFNAQMQILVDIHDDACLLDARPATFPSLPNSKFGDSMEIKGKKITVFDIVMHGNEVGMLLACVEDVGSLFGIMEVWEHVANVSSTMTRWRRTQNIKLADASDIIQAMAWIEANDASGHVDVLCLV